jgi:hypothetical protein
MTGWFWETDAALRFTYFPPGVEDINGGARGMAL